MNRKKMLSFGMAGLVLVMFLLSVDILAIYSGHDCTGDGCVVCVQLAQAKEAMVRIVCTFGSASLLLLIFFNFFFRGRMYVCPGLKPSTLVKLKVKLSD